MSIKIVIDGVEREFSAVLWDLDGTLGESNGQWLNPILKDIITFHLGQLGSHIQNRTRIKILGWKSDVTAKYFTFIKEKYGHLEDIFDLLSLSDLRRMALMKEQEVEKYLDGIRQRYGRGSYSIDIKKSITDKDIEKSYVDIAGPVYEKEVNPKSGARELVMAFHRRGMPQAIVSNCQREISRPFLKGHQMYYDEKGNEVFSLVMGQEDLRENTLLAKPAPDSYQHAGRYLQVPPEKCIVFEDSLVGVRAAVAAEMFVVVIYDEHQKKDHPEIQRLISGGKGIIVKDFSEAHEKLIGKERNVQKIDRTDDTISL